jgi:hypothetical protein
MDANDPLPYYASLAKVLHGPTLALVMTYLEIHHPPPQDTPELNSSPANTPILIDCDTACADLGISRRTLHVALSCLGACWGTEVDRNRAARSGREFLNPSHSLKPTGHDPVKIYSFTGPRQYLKPQILAMRRNYSKLASVLARAGLTHTQPQVTDIEAIGGQVSTVFTLPAILASVAPNWGDRRAGRWERWRQERGRKPTNVNRMAGQDRRKIFKDIKNDKDADEF